MALVRVMRTPAGQGEGYVEFTRDGRVVTKAGAKLPGLPSKSRYDEDVWPGNHRVRACMHGGRKAPQHT